MEFQYPTLKARLQELEAEIEKERLRERTLALEDIRRLMASVDLRPEDLRLDLQQNSRSRNRFLVRRPRKRAALVAQPSPMFIDPATGRCWSGRGRRPNWLTGDVERFRVVGF